MLQFDKKNPVVFIKCECKNLISKNNIFDHLEDDTVSKLKELDCKFLCNIQEIDSDLNLTEVLKSGDIIVRPDMKIFGVSSEKLTIEQMCQDLLSQITQNQMFKTHLKMCSNAFNGLPEGLWSVRGIRNPCFKAFPRPIQGI